jgi:hypothetical protein
MSEAQDLIKKARELVALADHPAVPARIGLVQISSVGEICSDDTGSFEGYEDTNEIVAIPDDEPCYEIGNAETVPLARLFAASLEMARLLSKMADALERCVETEEKEEAKTIMGWMCPHCHRCYSPFQYQCPHCGLEITTSPTSATFLETQET